MIKRRAALAAGAASCLPGALGAAHAQVAAQAAAQAATRPDAAPAETPAPRPVKRLRVAFVEAETSFDPVAINDIYSRTITGHIFEALLGFDHLARPAKLKPVTAAALPEAADDFRTWTFRLQPGIHFADDPAFKGARRELVADDYVYSLKRYADPANRAPNWTSLDSFKIVGLGALRQQAIDRKQPFDDRQPIEGLSAPHRYTLRIRLEQPRPRFPEALAASDIFGAVAREVVAFYGDRIGEHPVGTGPFRLKSWRRTSLTVLEKNPGYRPVYYDAQAEAGDAEGQAIQARFAGRRLPMVDEVHVTPIEETQPMWLAFLNGEIDALAAKYGPLPLDYVPLALPGGEIAPHLAKRGIRAATQVSPDVTLTYFNMEHPVIGGYTPERVALRRAIGLGLDLPREIRLVRRGQAIPAQSLVVPHTSGYDPQFKSESGDHDPARARALLDLYGYVDRDGDGWREQPDGTPLVLEFATQSDQITRQFDEVFTKDMQAIGLRVALQFGKWPEQLRQARAGKLMMWTLGSSADGPDGQGVLKRLHGPQAGGQNLARFALPAFDALYEKLSQAPDGPEREALFREAKVLAVAYAPYKPHVHRISNDLLHPWVHGYRRPIFWNEWWHLVDVDPVGQAKGGSMKRRTVVLGGAAMAVPAAKAVRAQPAPAGAGPDTGDAPKALKVLRYAFQIAETGFDPARIDDLYSRTITPHIFEGLYGYDHLARPPKIVPLTAAAMPEVADDYKTWTVRIAPGIRFASDPAFKGVRRELVAEDYVYSFKRFADPANLSPAWTNLEGYAIVGLAEQHQAAVKGKKPFDYARELPGLRALDRYTVQFRLEQPNPRFVELLAGGDLFGAVAREVVEAYGADIAGHPVGTGPFKLVQWRRSSLIALERNPEYRERYYDAQPTADDAEGQALLARLKGRRLPMIDRVEVSIIEEQQPRWLSFLNGEQNFMERLPAEFINTAMPRGKIAPNLARRGLQGHRVVGADATMHYFNMEDPVVGGYTPDKVALRRAINLGTDIEREIRLARRGQAIPAQSPVVPWTSGYDPAFKSENSDFSPARANALLDLYGYADRDGDGWRELPDGSPLELKVATQPSQLDRQFDELWRANMQAIGVRVSFAAAKWPENMKAARSGKLMVWSLGSSAASPDGQDSLSRLDGTQSGGQNLARFKLPEFDRLYERMKVMPDGPEREALFLKAKELAVAYAAYKYHVHRVITDMSGAGVVGYRRPTFWLDWWHLVDIEVEGARR